MLGSGGLVNVRTEDLKHLLRAVYRGDLPCPITHQGLASTGLLRLGDELDILRNLDARGVKAVLIAVLHERNKVS